MANAAWKHVNMHFRQLKYLLLINESVNAFVWTLTEFHVSLEWDNDGYDSNSSTKFFFS